MTALALALYVEGSTDKRFLPTVIERTAQHILQERGRVVVEVLPVMVLNDLIVNRSAAYEQRLLQAARLAVGYHALFVHADADARTRDKAMAERFEPIKAMIHQALLQGETLCETVLPLIPVRMIEAWMMSDPLAIRDELGVDMSPKQLGLPEKAAHVEKRLNPKQDLNKAIHIAFGNKRRRPQFNIAALYGPLGQKISIERLRGVPSFRQFEEDLTSFLLRLHLIQ